MKVIVTGGGTGGHIYPAIAIADKFKEMDPDTEILYVGNSGGIEVDVVPRTGYDMKFVNAKGIEKPGISEKAKACARIGCGIMESMSIMRSFKPDVIVGTGGYVCVPVIVAGKLHGVPCYIHEQNAFPGKANLLLEKFVRKVFLGFKEGETYFKHKEKLVYVGNPVRKTFFDAKREASREKMGFKPGEFVVLSFGGSLGSEKLNKVAFDLADAVYGHEGITFVLATGRDYYDQAKALFDAKYHSDMKNLIVKDYIDNMEEYLAASDLIISRSGALSLAEMTVCGKASVLIPSPNVTGNHQFFNAKTVADKGGAILIEEKDLTGEGLVKEVLKLKNNPSLLKSMEEASKKCAVVNTLDIIYNSIMTDLK